MVSQEQEVAERDAVDLAAIEDDRDCVALTIYPHVLGGVPWGRREPRRDGRSRRPPNRPGTASRPRASAWPRSASREESAISTARGLSAEVGKSRIVVGIGPLLSKSGGRPSPSQAGWGLLTPQVYPSGRGRASDRRTTRCRPPRMEATGPPGAPRSPSADRNVDSSSSPSVPRRIVTAPACQVRTTGMPWRSTASRASIDPESGRSLAGDDGPGTGPVVQPGGIG